MSEQLPPRHQSYTKIFQALQRLVEDIGVNRTAKEMGVSTDTVRRRIKGTQPWQFEEVMDLARMELGRGHISGVSKAMAFSLAPLPLEEAHPLLLPSNLRELLRLVGRLTTEIADTLEDGRVDKTEARRLLGHLDRLDGLTSALRIDLAALMQEG